MLFATLFVVLFVALCVFFSDTDTDNLSEVERMARKYQEVLDWEEVTVSEPAPVVSTESYVSTLEDIIVYLEPGTVELLALELLSLPDMTNPTSDTVKPAVGSQTGHSWDEWVWVEPADSLTGITVALFGARLAEIRERALTIYEEEGYGWVA